MKILTVLGARPQFIKAAAFSRVVKTYSNIEEVIVHTGQHYDPNMSDVFFEEMDIPKPKYILKTGGKSHGEMTGQQLESIEKILIEELYDLVWINENTNSTCEEIKKVKLINQTPKHLIGSSSELIRMVLEKLFERKFTAGTGRYCKYNFGYSR